VAQTITARMLLSSTTRTAQSNTRVSSGMPADRLAYTAIAAISGATPVLLV